MKGCCIKSSHMMILLFIVCLGFGFIVGYYYNNSVLQKQTKENFQLIDESTTISQKIVLVTSIIFFVLSIILILSMLILTLIMNYLVKFSKKSAGLL